MPPETALKFHFFPACIFVHYLYLVNKDVHIKCRISQTFQKCGGPQLNVDVGYLTSQLHCRNHHIQRFLYDSMTVTYVDKHAMAKTANSYDSIHT